MHPEEGQYEVGEAWAVVELEAHREEEEALPIEGEEAAAEEQVEVASAQLEVVLEEEVTRTSQGQAVASEDADHETLARRCGVLRKDIWPCHSYPEAGGIGSVCDVWFYN